MADEQAPPHLLLGDVYADPAAIDFLWLLLKARDGDGRVNISHREMPALEDHVAFVDGRPYKDWRIVYLCDTSGDRPIGAVYLSRQDEIGVHILPPFRQRGYGKWAVQTMMALHPEVKDFKANINPNNFVSYSLFRGLGFVTLQVTYHKVMNEPDIRGVGAGVHTPSDNGEDDKTGPG